MAGAATTYSSDGFKLVLAAVKSTESASWAVADAILKAVGAAPVTNVYEKLQGDLKKNGLDFKAASLRSYHQTAMAFPPDERREASFSAHETCKSDKKALDAAIEAYGPGPTVEEVRRVKANLKAGMPAGYVLPDIEQLTLEAHQAREAHEAAIRDGKPREEIDKLREESERASRILTEANLGIQQDNERRDRTNMKKVNEAIWLARALARTASQKERERLARHFQELAALYGEGRGDQREAA